MSAFSVVRVAGDAPAAQSFNNESPTMGPLTTDDQVAFATFSDPTIAPPRIVHACREERTRNGEARRENLLHKRVHAVERIEPSKVPEPTPTCLQVDRTRESTTTSLA